MLRRGRQRSLRAEGPCGGLSEETMTSKRDDVSYEEGDCMGAPRIKIKVQHTCSEVGSMSCIVWRSYFHLSHKGNPVLHILLDSGHMADWLIEGFFLCGMHFIMVFGAQ